MMGNDPDLSVAGNYRAFAGEARGRSAAYESLASAVAGDPLILGFLASLPPAKQQPNLLFAAARYLLDRPAGIDDLRDLVRQRRSELSGLIHSRRTQTNEPARCATLLPAMAQLPPPLALIEVGASAGLTLLVDRYSYDYAGHLVAGTDPRAPTLRCEPRGPMPLPERMPPVIWRAGLDINPLDLNDDDDVRWLSCLVWPGEGDRQERLAAAIQTARRDPPAVHRGDLLDGLPALAAQAPAEATLVVYHTSLLAYVSPDKRRRFADLLGGLPAVWLSNEAPGVVPGLPIPDGPELAQPGQPCILARDGHTPLAITDGHGAWVHWLR